MFLGVSVEVSELKYPQIIKQKQQTPNSNRHERSSSEYAEHIKENPNKIRLDYHVVTMHPYDSTRQRQLLESISLF